MSSFGQVTWCFFSDDILKVQLSTCLTIEAFQLADALGQHHPMQVHINLATFPEIGLNGIDYALPFTPLLKDHGALQLLEIAVKLTLEPKTHQYSQY